ncbi:MAG TPA: alpha/beta fold hydrolase [Gaiellaceae bacterium]|nr:alpha/beta fold hydrolase [Gaiellaceae bacterium]
MRLFSEAAGEGPGVVLIHAGICDSRMWEPQWRSFPHSHRTVRYDLRGFGRSPIPPGSYSNARDLVEVLQVNGLESASLVGVSLGGRVALELAIARPELVDRLVLVGPGLPGHAWSDEIEAFGAEEDAALERGDLDAAVEANLRTWVDGTRRSASTVDAVLRAQVGEMQRRAFELQLPVEGEADEELLVPDTAERLGEVQARSLVVVGDDDVSDMAVIAERLEHGIPDVRRASIAGTAHLPSLERPDEFDELVLAFLQEH